AGSAARSATPKWSCHAGRRFPATSTSLTRPPCVASAARAPSWRMTAARRRSTTRPAPRPARARRAEPMAALRTTTLLLAAGVALSACQTGRSTPPVATPAQAAVTPAVTPVAATTVPVPQVAALPPVDDDPDKLLGLDR